MAKQKQADISPAFNIGDRVRIRHYAGNPGRIVELRGALGPGGSQVYRVLVQRKPSVTYIEVRGDQLEALPPTSAKLRLQRNKLAERPDAPSEATGSTVK